MGKRSTGRKLAMQALYQAEIRQEPIKKVLEDSLEESSYLPETKDWAIALATQTWNHK
jgi:transcription termination factor NusB